MVLDCFWIVSGMISIWGYYCFLVLYVVTLRAWYCFIVVLVLILGLLWCDFCLMLVMVLTISLVMVSPKVGSIQ